MGKKTILLLLLIIGLGFYYAPSITKRMISITGNAVVDFGKDAANELSESEQVQELVQGLKQDINETVHNTADAIEDRVRSE